MRGTPMTRNERQQEIFDWCKDTFGQVSATPHERALRFLEEAVELVQAADVTPNEVRAIVGHVYDRPAGVPALEVGHVGVTLLAYCESMGFSAEREEEKEAQRVLSMDREEMRKRYLNKVRLGLAAPPATESYEGSRPLECFCGCGGTAGCRKGDDER